MTEQNLFIYALPMLLIWAGYALHHHLKHKRASQARDRAIADGLTQPASLHPLIDTSKCIGCGSCASACPEEQVLGLIHGKAELINPTHCIGHGACKTACPVQAITLVFGTAERGIDIPPVGTDFQSSMPGIYIAGELGGMGLIRNAIEQGKQAMDAIAASCSASHSGMLDVIVVGAGPAGISATLSAKEHGLQCVTLEQSSVGGTVAHYPRGKLVMTSPARLPIAGIMNFREVSKETLLQFWDDVIRKTGIEICFSERVESIETIDGGYQVKTRSSLHRTRAVLLAIGRRGTPRTLDVPGENLDKVVYRLIDPQQYRNCAVLVVGGGDSALEAAISIAEQPGTQVALSYRSGAFSRAKEKNRQRVSEMQTSGQLQVMLSSQVREIRTDDVDIEVEGDIVTLRNNAVIICAGGILPTPFLRETGIEVETKYGTE